MQQSLGEVTPTTGATGYLQPDSTATAPSYAPAVTFNLRYPGQQWDQETGLAYNINRYYDASSGRYIQADPIGLDGGWNRFVYVEGNPLSYIDPEGFQRKDPGSGAGPYHPPDNISLRCTSADDCPELKQKMELLKRMIDSHEGWDRANPSPRGGGRHAEEIAGLWRAYARCQEMWRKKDCDNCPPPKSFSDWVRDVFQPPSTTMYDPILERPVPVPPRRPFVVPLPGRMGGPAGSF